MSKLSNQTKFILEENISRGRLLELYPGHSVDSIDFLHSLTGNKIEAIGTEDMDPSHNIKYHKQKVPPFPRFLRKFDYIFLNEAEWLVTIECGSPADFTNFPEVSIFFIHNSLKKNGKFIISNVNKSVARVMGDWLNRTGNYSFDYEGEVAIFTKK